MRLDSAVRSQHMPPPQQQQQVFSSRGRPAVRADQNENHTNSVAASGVKAAPPPVQQLRHANQMPVSVPPPMQQQHQPQLQQRYEVARGDATNLSYNTGKHSTVIYSSEGPGSIK